jgi:hypothetical protein
MTTKVASVLTPIPVSNASIHGNTKAPDRTEKPFSNIEEITAMDNDSQASTINKKDALQKVQIAEPGPTKKTFRFYAIIVALALTGLLGAMESTITSTALPTIVADLGGAELFIWVVNGFYLTQ